MARKDTSDNKWGTGMRPGRYHADFDHMVSPLGEDCAETPRYSPSRTVNGSKGQRRGQVSVEDAEGQGPGAIEVRESRRNERRGG